MKKIIIKQKKLINLIQKNEGERVFLKKLIYNLKLTENIRNIAKNKLNNLSRNTSKVRLKNYCYITYNTNSVYRFSNMSRIKLKELILSGVLSGFSK